MNIKNAKVQIANTVKAYLAKDSYGRYTIPHNKQRPLFLMGPPGIGKTDIMSQVAEELGICLLSYSMIHHTRQSVLGLPIIRSEEYKGMEFKASEYSMSEIIGSVYSIMKSTGIENGILFLDEINCISETLTPIMLQFLQYKTFGGHKLPDGWIVATAGNPPEYNSSVRDFDIVTWDRVKRIDIEPEFSVWKEFAYQSGIHPSVLTYLEIKPQNFYKIETTVNGKSFVTARGWDDLSRILGMYEQLGIDADEELISQYIQNKHIAEDFAIYYELYKKYKNDYRIGDILSGSADDPIVNRAASAKFDERYSLLGLLLETIGNESRNVLQQEELLAAIKETICAIDDICKIEQLDNTISELEIKRERLISANNLSSAKDNMLLSQIDMLKKYRMTFAEDPDNTLKSSFEADVAQFKKQAAETKAHYSNMFGFCEKAFGSGQELLILVTELAANPITARFISQYGCDEYYKHDKALMFHQRRLKLIDEINSLPDE